MVDGWHSTIATAHRMQTSSLYAHTPQLVVCKDARTNRKIIIVGSVHFNPASIALAKVTVENTPDLGAVVVESCEVRLKRYAKRKSYLTLCSILSFAHFACRFALRFTVKVETIASSVSTRLVSGGCLAVGDAGGSNIGIQSWSAYKPRRC